MNTTIFDIRKAQLENLVREFKKPGLLATRVGKKPAQISQWLSGHRKMTEISARDVERKAGKPPRWMDAADSATEYGEADDGLDQATETIGITLAQVPPPMREAVAVNLAGWARDGGADHWRQSAMRLIRHEKRLSTG